MRGDKYRPVTDTTVEIDGVDHYYPGEATVLVSLSQKKNNRLSDHSTTQTVLASR